MQIIIAVVKPPALFRHFVGHRQVRGLTGDHAAVQSQIVGGSLIADGVDVITGSKGPVKVIIYGTAIGFCDGIVPGIPLGVCIVGSIRAFLTLLSLDGNSRSVITVLTTQSKIAFC